MRLCQIWYVQRQLLFTFNIFFHSFFIRKKDMPHKAGDHWLFFTAKNMRKYFSDYLCVSVYLCVCVCLCVGNNCLSKEEGLSSVKPAGTATMLIRAARPCRGSNRHTHTQVIVGVILCDPSLGADQEEEARQTLHKHLHTYVKHSHTHTHTSYHIINGETREKTRVGE